jgi:hypothetical protein
MTAPSLTHKTLKSNYTQKERELPAKNLHAQQKVRESTREKVEVESNEEELTQHNKREHPIFYIFSFILFSCRRRGP